MRPSLFAARVTFLLACCATPAAAEIRTQVLEYRHGELALEGFLAWDDAVASEQKPRPGVLVCPEWWGNNDYARSRAKKLAELGYVALAIDVYGQGRITQHPEQASEWSKELFGDPAALRARVKLGYDLLIAQKTVDRARVAAIGYCMGGTIALELARTGVDLRCVVAFHAGKLTSLGSKEDVARIKASVTICHGQEDTFVKAEELRGFHEEMKAAGRDYQFLSYGRAVHGFTNPDAGQYGVDGLAYDAAADRRSWEHMKLAFAEAFGASAAR